MDADQLRVKAYELALLTFARHPMAIGVDQILAEAHKIEGWLSQPSHMLQPTAMPAHHHGLVGAGGSVYAGNATGSGWVTVGSGAPAQPVADLPLPKPIKRADW